MTKRARPVVGEVMTNAQLRETWTETQFQSAVEGLMREFGWHYYHTRFSLGSQGGFPTSSHGTRRAASTSSPR